MNLSAPSQAVFWVAVIIAIIAIIGALTTIPFISTYAFWICLLAFIVLAVGCFVQRT